MGVSIWLGNKCKLKPNRLAAQALKHMPHSKFTPTQQSLDLENPMLIMGQCQLIE